MEQRKAENVLFLNDKKKKKSLYVYYEYNYFLNIFKYFAYKNI